MAEIVNYGHKQTAALQITTGLYPSTATSLDMRETVADMDILSQPVPVGCKLYPGLRIFVEDPPQTVTVLGKLPGADGSLWSHWIFDSILPAFKDAIDESQTEARYLGMVKPNDYTPENLLNYLFLRCHGSQIVTHKVIVTYAGLPTSPITVEYSYQENESYTITPQDFPGYIPDIPSISGVMGTEDVYYTVNYQIAEYALKYWVIDQQDDRPYRTYNVQYHSTVPVPETNPPRDGYTFQGWNYIGGLDNGDKMPAHNVDAKANWQRIIPDYTISVTANPSNGGTVDGGGTYAEGTNCVVTATANNEYTFTNWTEDGDVVSASATYTFQVNSDRDLVANFSKNTRTISVSTNPINAGTVSGGGTYDIGSQCTVAATANDGFEFTGWTEGNIRVYEQPSYTFTVEGNRTLVAQFSQSVFNISAKAEPSEGGSTSGGGTFNYGDTCTLTATPATGYEFTNWTKNGTVVSENAVYSFDVTESVEYTANFKVSEYKVYAFPMYNAPRTLGNIDFTDKNYITSSTQDGLYKTTISSVPVTDPYARLEPRNLIVAIPSALQDVSSWSIFVEELDGDAMEENVKYNGYTTIDGTQYFIKASNDFPEDEEKNLLFGNTSSVTSWRDAWEVAVEIPQSNQ